MDNITLLVPILKQDDSILSLLNSVNFSAWKKVIVLFDSCGFDYVSIVEENYPKIGGISNTSKAFGFSRLVNLGLKAAVELDSSVFITSQYSVLPPCFKPFGVDGIANYEHKEKPSPLISTFIHKDVIDKIGYLDEAFVNSGSSEDYRMRAALAGFPDVWGWSDKESAIMSSKKTLEITDFAEMQLCYKYGEKGLTAAKLFDKVMKKFTFTEEMAIK